MVVTQPNRKRRVFIGYEKLVLICPPSPWLISDRDQPYLGLLYLSSFLKKKGLNVVVCDLAGLPEEYWYIPVGDVYGITGTTPHFPYMKKIITKLKARDPNCTVIVGGVHASVYPEHIIENTEADMCIVGDGEYQMLDLFKNTIDAELDKFDIELMPFPDREAVDYFDYLKMQTYRYIGDGRDASILTGRGCPYKCAFCASYKLNKGKVRLRSAENVAAELSYLAIRYGVEYCNFVDDTFILNKERIKSLCKIIKNMGIQWYFLTRVDHVDLDLFKLMYEAGCRGVTFGFESGSNRMLKRMNKNTTVEQAHKAIEISKKAGFKIRGQLMIGFPGENDESIGETIDFIHKAVDVDKFGVHVFQPFPGTDVWENPKKYGCMINKDTDFNSYHTIGKPGSELSEEYRINMWMVDLKNIIEGRNIDSDSNNDI